MSDYNGGAALLGAMPAAKALLADRDYDADMLRDALADRKIENMFGKLKDWRRIHTPVDRCAPPSCQQSPSSGYDQ